MLRGLLAGLGRDSLYLCPSASMLAHVTCSRNAVPYRWLSGVFSACSGHWVSGVSRGLGLQALRSTVAQMRGAMFGVVVLPEQKVGLPWVVTFMWWWSVPEATLRDQHR